MLATSAIGVLLPFSAMLNGRFLVGACCHDHDCCRTLHGAQCQALYDLLVVWAIHEQA